MSDPQKPLWCRNDFIRQAAKAVWCVIQLLILSAISRQSVESLRISLIEEPSAEFALMQLLAVTIFFLALWRYYDTIDDGGFAAFCAAEPTPKLLKSPAHLLHVALTVVGATPVLASPVVAAIGYWMPTMPVWLGFLLGGGAALVFVLGVSLLRLRGLTYEWGVQKQLRESTDKAHKTWVRVAYALVFLVALGMATVMFMELFAPALFSIAMAILELAIVPLMAVLAGLLVWWLLHSVRRVKERRRYLARLDAMQARGELTYTVHGDPIRSLFSSRLDFGLTITDEPHPDAKVPTRRTYTVAFANCGHRHMAIVLCPNNVFRFVYTVKLRAFNGFSVMNTQDRVLTIPMLTLFVNRSFEFPEGDGERILLMDPAPACLCTPGRRSDELVALDNGSKVFDYTVYGRNAFLHLLERY